MMPEVKDDCFECIHFKRSVSIDGKLRAANALIKDQIEQIAELKGVINEYLGWGTMTTSDRHYFEQRFKEVVKMEGMS
jgi:hypothetical protein